MAGSLTEAQVEHFRREGYAFPFDAISSGEAAACVAKLDSYDAILGEECQKQQTTHAETSTTAAAQAGSPSRTPSPLTMPPPR